MEFLTVNHRRPSREMPLGLVVKKDGCFRRLSLAGCHTGPVYPDPIGIWDVAFCGGRTTGVPGEFFNLLNSLGKERINKKLSHIMAPGQNQGEPHL